MARAKSARCRSVITFLSTGPSTCVSGRSEMGRARALLCSQHDTSGYRTHTFQEPEKLPHFSCASARAITRGGASDALASRVGETGRKQRPPPRSQVRSLALRSPPQQVAEEVQAIFVNPVAVRNAGRGTPASSLTPSPCRYHPGAFSAPAGRATPSAD